MYEFRCHRCRQDYTVLLDPDNDDLQHQTCEVCGKEMGRVFSFQLGHIAYPNGGWHGEGINLAAGQHFKSTRERDYFMDSHGLVKEDKYTGESFDAVYKRRVAAKKRVEDRLRKKNGVLEQK